MVDTQTELDTPVSDLAKARNERGCLPFSNEVETMPKKALTYEDIVALTAAWPGVTPGQFYGTPGLKVGTKGFCRMWSDREYVRDGIGGSEILVVMCDVDEKPLLIEASGGVAFETPHYQGHGAMLIRLADAGEADLLGYLEDAYREKATKKLIAAFDAAADSTGLDT